MQPKWPFNSYTPFRERQSLYGITDTGHWMRSYTDEDYACLITARPHQIELWLLPLKKDGLLANLVRSDCPEFEALVVNCPLIEPVADWIAENAVTPEQIALATELQRLLSPSAAVLVDSTVVRK